VEEIIHSNDVDLFLLSMQKTSCIMLLHINSNKSVGDLQDKFNECFPAYKLEFFRNKNDFKKDIPLQEGINLQAFAKPGINGILDFKSWFTAQQLLNAFKSDFDLLVKLYHSENGKWQLMPADLKLNMPSQPVQSFTTVSENEEEEEVQLEL